MGEEYFTVTRMTAWLALAVAIHCQSLGEMPIPEVKSFHLTFEEIQDIGHRSALPFIDSEEFWTINGKQYPKSRSLNAFDYNLGKGNEHEDSEQINKLIALVSNDPEIDTIYFPAATYYVSDHIVLLPGVNIIGAGQGKTVFERRDKRKYLVRGSGDYLGAVVANLTLYNQERILLMHDASHLNFFHVDFRGGIVRFTKSKNLVFEGNIFNDNIGKAGYASAMCKNVRIVNNTINSIVKGGLNLSGHEDSYVAYNYISSPELIKSGYAGIRLPNSAKNNLVEYNYVKNHGRGLFVLSYSTDNTLQYNLVDVSKSQGVLIQGSKNVLKGNIIKDAGKEAICVVNGSIGKKGRSIANSNIVIDNIVYDSEPRNAANNIGLRVSTSNNCIERNIVHVNNGRTFKKVHESTLNLPPCNRSIE